MLDQLGRRYGRLPSELLQLDPDELTLNALAMGAGLDLADRMCREVAHKGGMVFPTREVG